MAQSAATGAQAPPGDASSERPALPPVAEDDPLLLEWCSAMNQVQEVVAQGMVGSSASDAGGGDELQDEETAASRVYWVLHHTVENLLTAGRLENILGSEFGSVGKEVVLGFLVDQVSNTMGGVQDTLTKDLAQLLRVQSWRDAYKELDLTAQLPPACRFKLQRFAAVAAAESTGDQELAVPDALSSEQASQFLFDVCHGGHNHRLQAKDLVQKALQQATTSLVAAGARIVIVGDAGSGKSSCCNAAFGKALAAAGTGMSVTQDITLYEATAELPVHIYDTKGFETLSDNQDALAQLKKLIKERQEAVAQLGDDPEAVKECLHAVWWVINVGTGGRFNPKTIDKLSSMFGEAKVPLIILLNKCDAPAEYVAGVESEVKKHCLSASHVVRVVADAQNGPMMLQCEACGSDDITINKKHKHYNREVCGRQKVPLKRCYGFEELVKVTADCLPDMVACSFLASQKVWLHGLNKVALRDICGFAVAAAGIGGAPIPFFTRLCLYPLQVAMVARLAHIYGVVLSWKAANHVLLSLTAVTGIGLAGWLGASLLKMIPGLNVVGCISDATVSGLLTLVMGLISQEMMKRVRGRALVDDTDVTPEDIVELMGVDERKELFRRYFERLQAPFQELLSDVQDGSVDMSERLARAVERMQADDEPTR